MHKNRSATDILIAVFADALTVCMMTKHVSKHWI